LEPDWAPGTSMTLSSSRGRQEDKKKLD